MAALSATNKLSQCFELLLSIRNDLVRIHPDPTFEVVPDLDPILQTRPTKQLTNLSVRIGTAAILLKHFRYFFSMEICM